MSFHSSYLLLWLVLGLVISLTTILWGIFHRKRIIRRLSSAPNGASSSLVSNAGPVRGLIQLICLVIALITLAFALLRPSSGREITEYQLPAKNIVILLDVSKSMGVVDINGVSRMDMAKVWLKQFIANRPYDRIALVTFSGIALPECPLTRDRSILNKMIDFQEAGILPIGGTDLEGALDQARKFLGKHLELGSSVMLLSDGDDVTGDPRKAASFFTEAEVPLNTIAIGNPSQVGVIPADVIGKAGARITSQADPSILAELSDATNGLHIAISEQSQLESSSDRVHEAIDSISVDGENIFNEVFSRPIDIYQYPLTITILMLLIRMLLSVRTSQWHKLCPGVAVLFIFFSLFINKAHAQLDATSSDPEEKSHQTLIDYDEAKVLADEQDKPLVILFTGSDWSKSSIAFQREIYPHEVFQNWVKQKVVLLHADLPRKAIDPKLREQNRALAKKYEVSAYPAIIFIKPHSDTVIGRLKHDSRGPASWVERAQELLKGNKGDEYSSSSIVDLSMEDSLSNLERAIKNFDQALKLEATNPELVLTSKDQFRIVIDLLEQAAGLADEDHPEIMIPPIHKLGVLHHLRGMSLFSVIISDENNFNFKKRTKQCYEALAYLEAGYDHYTIALSYETNNENLTRNIALIMSDMEKLKQLIELFKIYSDTIQETFDALNTEKWMLKEQQNFVTTSREVNDRKINDAATLINKLITSAKKLNYHKLEDLIKAGESIAKSPVPHKERSLVSSEAILQETLDYLIPPFQVNSNGKKKRKGGSRSGAQQNPEGSQAEEDEDSEEEKDDSSANEEESSDDSEELDDDTRDFSQSEADSALKKADEQNGTLRDHAIEKLKKGAKKPYGSQDR